MTSQKVGVDMHTQRSLSGMWSIEITDGKSGDTSLTYIKLYSPGRTEISRPYSVMTARTPHDVDRIRRKLMGKHRVPNENVADLRAKASGSKDGGNAQNGSSIN